MLLVPTILLISYYLGLPLKLIVPILSLVYLILILKVSNQSERKAQEKSGLFLKIILCFSPVVILGVQLARLKNGGQGIDFSIFAQVVHNLSVNYKLESSLIDWQWQHFLTHHFSPYLYIIGAINKIVNNAEVTLLCLHAVTVGAILVLLFKIAFLVDRDTRTALLLPALIILLPAVRIGLLWEVHDEIFALPYLLGAYLNWLKKKHLIVILCLFCSTLFKETMFLVTSAFACMALIESYMNKDLTESKIRIQYLLCFVIGIICFVLYSKILPSYAFTPTFSTFSRLGTLSYLLQSHILHAKFYWLGVIIAPIIPLLLVYIFSKRATNIINIQALKKLSIRYILLLIPVSPFLSAIMLSSFEEMHKPYNYYSILPAILLTTTLFIATKSVNVNLKIKALICCSLIACCIGPRIRIPSEVKTAIFNSSPIERLSSVVPLNSVVISGDWDTTFFIKHKQIIRLFHANRNILKFDFIVLRKSLPPNSANQHLSAYLRNWSKLCYEDDLWQVRCALGKMKATL